MRLTVGSWNIGGGVLGASHQRNAPSNLDYYAKFLSDFSPDILCVQEAHSFGDSRVDQVLLLADLAGYEHSIEASVSPSHIDDDALFSLGVLSRFPIEDFRYEQFPRFEMSSVGPDGHRWSVHDKGFLVASLKVGNTPLAVVNAHCFPFHYFQISPVDERVAGVWQALDAALCNTAIEAATVACIDLNCANLDALLPRALGESGFRSAINDTPTTPKGLQQDFLLFDGNFRLTDSGATETESDHSYCEMTLEIARV